MNNYISKQVKDILHIFIPTYKRNIYYINTGSVEKYKEILNKQLRVKNLGNFNDSAIGNFAVFQCNNTPVGVIRCSRKKIPELAHECLHATFWIMEDVGMSLNEGSEEAYCYLQMMILNEILKKC